MPARCSRALPAQAVVGAPGPAAPACAYFEEVADAFRLLARQAAATTAQGRQSGWLVGLGVTSCSGGRSK